MLSMILNEGLLLVVLLSGVPLAISAMTGLAVAIIQAATQIQEQSIAYLVKFLTLVITTIFGWVYFWEVMLIFLQRILVGMSLVR